MRMLVAALVVLVAAVSLALGVLKEPGYILIAYGTWSVESSLALFLFALLVLYGLLYFAMRALLGLRRMPRELRQWERRRKTLKARNALNRGLIELAEGQWEEAERRLSRYAGDSDNPLLNYLAAARAAQQQGEHERRDHYLRMAHRSMPAADIAVGLTQAELQIAHRQMEQALATLTHLRTIAPRHGYVLKMLMKLYLRLRDWEHLRDVLPELRRRKVAPEEELDRLEARVHGELLDQATRRHDLTALQGAWEHVPRRLAHDESLLLTYAGHLRALGAGAEAEPLLRAALKRHWSERLAYLYGQLEGPDPVRQLADAEGWLKGRERDAVLLLSLGRLAMRTQLWGKARSYLEASIGVRPTVESYQLLGRLLEQMDDTEAAMACYRKGMLLAAEGGAVSGLGPAATPVAALAAAG